jgi:hypothetical protein
MNVRDVGNRITIFEVNKIYYESQSGIGQLVTRKNFTGKKPIFLKYCPSTR